MRSPRRPVRTTLQAGACAAVLLTAAACGGGGGGGGGGSSFAGESAQDIIAAAKKDTTSVSSLKLSGTLTTGGKQISMDLQLDDAGTCTGSIKLDGGSAEILGTGGQYWFKPDTAFWQAEAGAQAQQIIALVGDKYVASDQFKSICDLNQFFADTDKSEHPDTKGKTSTIDGKETIEIDSTDDDGNPISAYVLTSSPHYVVKLVGQGSSSGDDKGEFTLSNFGDTLNVQAPAPSDVVTLPGS